VGISFILLWNSTFDDVDSYITFPKKNTATTTGGDVDQSATTAPVFTTPYDWPWVDADSDSDNDLSDGFSPETWNSGTPDTVPARGSAREMVYYGVPSTASDSSATWDSSAHTNTLNLGTVDLDYDEDGTAETWYISLDTDATQGSGPETITVRAFPFVDPAVNVSTTGGASTGLATGTNYTWVGVMEYYVDAYDSNWEDATNDTSTEYLSTVGEGSQAGAVLWIVQGTTILGKYTIPDYTKVKGASVVRVNCFYNSDGYEVYQIVPDLRVLQSTSGIRSIGDDGIITVTGGKQRSR
jgi:hypothetical protein